MFLIEKILYGEHYISVSLNTGESLKFFYDILSVCSLASGMELDQEAYNFLKEESEKAACRQKAFSYLAIRQRSEMEITTYLRKKKFNPRIIDEAVLYLKEKKYLNDFDFAVAYAQSISAKKPAGLPYIKHKLYAKGITGKTADKAIKKAGCWEDDIDAVVGLAEKKLRSLINKTDRKARLYRYLAGRGFRHETIKKAIIMLDIHDETSDDFGVE